MKKKIVAFTMAALMAVSLAGCGNKELSNEYITISQYKGLEVPKPDSMEISDEFVDQQIQALLDKSAVKEEVTDRAAQLGDIVSMDYTGTIDGTAFDGGTAAGAELELGSNRFIGPTEDYKGFEEQLVGHSVGDDFDIEVQFPSSYPNNPDLQDVVAVFNVKLNNIYTKTVPELTDDWVTTVSDTSSTVDEYKKEVKENLEKTNESNIEAALVNASLQALMANTEVKEIPEDLLQAKIDYTNDYYKEYAQTMNMEFTDFCEQVLGMSEDDYNAQVKQMSEQMVMGELACQLVAQKNNLEPSEKEYAEKMEEFAKNSGYESVDELLKYVDEKELKMFILQDIVGKYLAEHCVQVEGTPQLQP